MFCIMSELVEFITNMVWSFFVQTTIVYNNTIFDSKRVIIDDFTSLHSFRD